MPKIPSNWKAQFRHHKLANLFSDICQKTSFIKCRQNPIQSQTKKRIYLRWHEVPQRDADLTNRTEGQRHLCQLKQTHLITIKFDNFTNDNKV